MNKLIELPNHKDDRGNIQMILENCNIGSVSRITTLGGKTRARHYHPKDYHYIETLVGEVWLYERPVGSNEIPTLKVVKVGDIAFTGPNVEHEMFMPIYTVFNCYSLLPRNTDNYESETVRFQHSLKTIYDQAPYQNG